MEADPQGRTTGCRIEARQVYTAERLIRLIRWLGLLSPMAVRLLQVRDVARRAPVDVALVAARVAARADQAARHCRLSPSESLTVTVFWREVARLGGYLARTREGPPGWRTRWQGWRYLQTVLQGGHLAAHLQLSLVGKDQAFKRGMHGPSGLTTRLL